LSPIIDGSRQIPPIKTGVVIKESGPVYRHANLADADYKPNRIFRAKIAFKLTKTTEEIT
jgi:hypothetical protein